MTPWQTCKLDSLRLTCGYDLEGMSRRLLELSSGSVTLSTQTAFLRSMAKNTTA